jgi:ABC-type dipeptide/oligopeptide/nickel transport system permease subunit
MSTPAATIDQSVGVEELKLGQGIWGVASRFTKTSPIGAISALFLVVLALVTIFAGQIAPYHPLEADFTALREPPSPQHWMGTDNLGRDVLSRLLHGGRISLSVALISTLLSKVLGFAWGVMTGYLGSTFDLVSQRIVDVLLAFPGIILAMLLLSALGGGFTTVVVAITLLSIAGTVRVIRSVVLSIKEMAYVESARAVGSTSTRVMAQHIAPQCVAPILVLTSASLGGAIFSEAALSFLGLGIPQPSPSWGNMLGGVLANQFRPQWWLVIYPGLTITITILAFNLVGDALRDHLDPKLRGRIH